MFGSKAVAFGVVLALACGAGCGSRTDSRVAELEKRIESLERELAAMKSGSGAAARAPGAGAPGPVVHASWKGVPIHGAAEKGLTWLVSVQGEDGGWGQDGGRQGDARSGVNLETTGNDVANTALVCLALFRAGHSPRDGAWKDAIRKGIEFILKHAEKAPEDGLAIADRQGTQIQRKLGPHIDTFLATLVLSEADGQMPDEASQKRVRAALNKCVAKIEKNQQKDGSWNIGDGWAPLIGTSMASRGLYRAQEKGLAVSGETLRRVDSYTALNYDSANRSFKTDKTAGVELYAAAQSLEQNTRVLEAGERASTPAPATADMRRAAISDAKAKLGDAGFVGGFGSMGGEEFVSYLNISDSLLRAGGEDWTKWNARIKDHIVKLQNQDGTWAGHHCITGRVACTSAAVMTILAERSAPRME